MSFLKIICVVITVVFFGDVHLVSLKSKLNAVKKEAKNILLANWKQSRGLSQVGDKPGTYLDYPGQDAIKLQKNKELWNLYYKCLEEQVKYIKKNHIFQAKVVTAFKSFSIQLECPLCISPRDLLDKNVWYYSKLEKMSNISSLEDNDYFRISSLDLSLTIINMDDSKSGMYQCKFANTEAGPYFVEVLNDTTEPIIQVNNTLSTAITDDSVILDDLRVKVWTQWTEWTTCSKCDVMGKQSKFGYCFMSMVPSNFQKKNNEDDIENIMNAFDMGIPCHSSLLNDLYSSDNRIKNMPTKIMIGYCTIQCNNNEIFEMLDPRGNVIEKVNNSAGVYSSLQIIPEVAPKVEQTLIVTYINQQLNITCPGNLNSDAPYEWKSNGRTIPSLLSNTKHERIHTDALNRLIIKNVTDEDETIFTCWQVDYLAGTVHIKIIKKFKLSIQEDVYLYASLPIIGMFIWVGFRMFFDKEASY